MGNAIIGFPNQVDDTAVHSPALSGGSWSSGLPLVNLKNRNLTKVARSNTANPGATRFQIALGRIRSVLLIAIPAHNMTTSAKIRAVASNSDDFNALVYDTGSLDVFPQIYAFGTLQFGDPDFWLGRLSPEARAGINVGFVHVLPQPVFASHWLFEIDDAENPDGYVELSRLFLTPGYRPTINIQPGAALGFQTDTARQRSLGGVDFFDVRRQRRTAQFTVDFVSKDEALANSFEIMWRQGINGDLFFVFDPDDPLHLHRTSFPATLERLSAVTFPSSSVRQTRTTYQLVETL